MKPRAHVLELSHYQMSNKAVPEGKRPLILSQNESMFGYSPLVDLALDKNREAISLYPSVDLDALRQSIAHVHKLDPDNLVFGLGSTDLIVQLCMLFLEPGRSLVTSQYGYVYLRKAVKMAGAETIFAAEPTVGQKSVDNLLAAIRPDTTLLFLDNPGNPTAELIPRSEVIRLIDNLPDHVLLILDEAYAEFIDPNDYEPNFDLMERGNVVILRTFSKIYGLAGLRIGWGYFPKQIADYIALIRPRLTNTALGIAAAEAAVRDQEFMIDVREKTAVIRQTFCDQLTSLGIHPLPSQTNFVLCRFASTEDAQGAQEHLRSEGIVIRPVDVYGLTDHLRITIGTAEQMNLVYENLKDWRLGNG
ncbi:MAG: histidinol-phosphate transaminase [Chloroflexota bacterium]